MFQRSVSAAQRRHGRYTKEAIKIEAIDKVRLLMILQGHCLPSSRDDSYHSVKQNPRISGSVVPDAWPERIFDDVEYRGCPPLSKIRLQQHGKIFLTQVQAVKSAHPMSLQRCDFTSL